MNGNNRLSIFRILSASAILLSAGVAGAAPVPSGCKPRPQVEGHVVTGAGADRLRLAPGTTRGATADEFLLRDGRILVQPESGEGGVIYAPEAYKLRRAQLADELKLRRVARGESFHPLRGYIDDGGGFARLVPQLLADLHRRLATDGLDASATPAALDALAARWREHNCRPEPSVFRELTAQVGDLLVRKAGGRWTTQDRGSVVEPVVEVTVAGEKRALTPWAWTQGLLAGEVSLGALIDEALAPPAKPDKTSPNEVAAVPPPPPPVDARREAAPSVEALPR